MMGIIIIIKIREQLLEKKRTERLVLVCECMCGYDTPHKDGIERNECQKEYKKASNKRNQTQENRNTKKSTETAIMIFFLILISVLSI